MKTGDVKVIIHEEGDPYIGIELASIHFINNYNVLFGGQNVLDMDIFTIMTVKAI